MLRLRARFSDAEPAGYRELNRKLTEEGSLVPPSSTAVDLVTGSPYAGLGELSSTVQIVQCPLELEDKTKTGAIAEMARLESDGALTALRGERPTDLARPLEPETARHVRITCPHLTTALGAVERFLAGTDLFVRAVKYDRARASSTEPSSDRQREHLHFDAELSSLAEYDEPVFQFYLNLGKTPRQFRILPVPLAEMLERLVREGALGSAAAAATPLTEILGLHRRLFPTPLEIIPVESLCLAVFDGRTFAHDAGKTSLEALLQGSLVPAEEDDLVLALDTTATGHHHGLYDPSRPFLEDLRP